MASLGRSFNRLLTASALSNLADGVFQVALPLLAVTLTRSPGLVAGVALAQRLPWLFMALPAGALADRLDRRRTMVRVDLLRVAVMGGIAVSVALDVASMQVLYVAALALGVGETLFDTAAQSIVPSLIPREQLSRANGNLQAVELTMNAFVGPPLGGLLAAAAMTAAFGFSSAAYLLAALALVSISGSFRPERADPPTKMRAEIAEGLRFVWGNPVLRTLGLVLGVMNMASMAHFSVFVLYAVEPGPMGLSTTGYGILFGVTTVGGLVGSWLAPRVEQRFRRSRVLLSTLVVMGIVLAVPAFTTSVVLNAIAFICAAGAGVTWNVITVSLRQRMTPDRLMGRMNSAYRLLGWGMMPVGSALGGLIAEVWGLRPVFVIAALLHVPLLFGFLVVTEARIEAADTVSAT